MTNWTHLSFSPNKSHELAFSLFLSLLLFDFVLVFLILCDKKDKNEDVQIKHSGLKGLKHTNTFKKEKEEKRGLKR